MMAKMVFGRMCYEADYANKREVMHFATAHNSETGYTVACGQPRLTWRMRVYSGFSASGEQRVAKGEQMTNCKKCRRAMGWATPTD